MAEYLLVPLARKRTCIHDGFELLHHISTLKRKWWARITAHMCSKLSIYGSALSVDSMSNDEHKMRE